MKTVSQHLRAIHEQTARRSGAMRDVLAKSEARYRKAADAFRARHRVSNLPESPDSELATAFDSIAEDFSELKKLFDADETFHRGAMVEVEKSAAAADLTKSAVAGRGADDIVPSRVQAINRGANHLIPRSGTPVARTGTDDAPVAPQLSKLVAIDD